MVSGRGLLARGQLCLVACCPGGALSEAQCLVLRMVRITARKELALEAAWEQPGPCAQAGMHGVGVGCLTCIRMTFCMGSFGVLRGCRCIVGA